jgi:hypothetical protein
MKEFDDQGCEICRQQWLSGTHPRELFVCASEQVSFYQCDACGAYWEETNRYAAQVDQDRVQRCRDRRVDV